MPLHVSTTQCSKHVEAHNKSYYKIKNLCIKLVNYQDYTEMHGQQNIKIYQHVSAVTYSHLVLPDDGYRL